MKNKHISPHVLSNIRTLVISGILLLLASLYLIYILIFYFLFRSFWFVVWFAFFNFGYWRRKVVFQFYGLLTHIGRMFKHTIRTTEYGNRLDLFASTNIFFGAVRFGNRCARTNFDWIYVSVYAWASVTTLPTNSTMNMNMKKWHENRHINAYYTEFGEM